MEENASFDYFESISAALLVCKEGGLIRQFYLDIYHDKNKKIRAKKVSTLLGSVVPRRNKTHLMQNVCNLQTPKSQFQKWRELLYVEPTATDSATNSVVKTLVTKYKNQ